MSLTKATLQTRPPSPLRDPKEEIKTTPIYSILSLNYLIFLAFVMFISGFFTFAAIGFTILSITPIVILFHRNPDWKKLAVSFTLWFAVIYLIARISRHEMATAYLALFACSNIVISILLWLFISGRMTIQNLVMSLSVYAGLIIVTVMAAQNMGHDVIGMLTHRIEIYIGSIITSLKKYNLQDADQQNLLFLQEMAISFVKTCPAALIYITVLLAGFLNLFLARLFLIPAAHRIPRLRHPTRKKEPMYDENNDVIEEPKPLFEDEIPPGPLSPEGLQLGFNLVWVFIASWAGLLVSYIMNNPMMRMIFLNAFLICSALYILQGLMVLGSFYRRLSMNRTIKIVILFFALTILPTLILTLCVCSLGLFDAWFDLRKLKSDGGH